MAGPLPTGIISHSRKVCSLYKRALRNLEAWISMHEQYRYEAVLLRARFDENKDLKDLRKGKELLLAGEEELWQCLHPAPIYFAESPEGVAYQRDVPCPDWILDQWHPTEKAMYPKYFALREKRKKEYIEFYKKQYPNAPTTFHLDDH
ncbi:NADH dehydrogenase [ubiquinone] 1 beta subcomplex subunit 9 [Fopius arisanus]|uniref:NADH dehydrogenase [ubiquinone] 1 beta subcomplex subunit 9 n=1 Tax=Fopius arisanus TaxID=64838 RepID=A0A9R1U6K9_9HYME|nr:PREDICTED: NADH dehydrogenase [ubiquinone] 1 beta subcomplex subunit 9 [Fopius arisanus]